MKGILFIVILSVVGCVATKEVKRSDGKLGLMSAKDYHYRNKTLQQMSVLKRRIYASKKSDIEKLHEYCSAFEEKVSRANGKKFKGFPLTLRSYYPMTARQVLTEDMMNDGCDGYKEKVARATLTCKFMKVTRDATLGFKCSKGGRDALGRGFKPGKIEKVTLGGNSYNYRDFYYCDQCGTFDRGCSLVLDSTQRQSLLGQHHKEYVFDVFTTAAKGKLVISRDDLMESERVFSEIKKNDEREAEKVAKQKEYESSPQYNYDLACKDYQAAKNYIEYGQDMIEQLQDLGYSKEDATSKSAGIFQAAEMASNRMNRQIEKYNQKSGKKIKFQDLKCAH